MSRIPELNINNKLQLTTAIDFEKWCDDLIDSELMFHFEDYPHSIVNWQTNERIFNDEECKQIESYLRIANKSNLEIMNIAWNCVERSI